MASQRGLTVRGHERQLIELPVEFLVDEAHRGQVRFSATSQASNHHQVKALTFDLSVGGLGFRSSLYLPRHCEGLVHVMSPRVTPEGKGLELSCVRITHRMKVRRVWMDDRDAMYSIGLAFVNATPQLEAQVVELLKEWEQHVADRAKAQKGAVNNA